MCELLGMSFNQPVGVNLSFRSFRHRSDKNPHGWGIAYYPDESAQVIKEPMKAKESPLSKFFQDYPRIKSKIFISHVRYASAGENAHKNTHPFQRELFGKDFVFAHNGTLDYFWELPTGHFTPVGETDSEHVFCHILNWLEERRVRKWTEDDFDQLWEKLLAINELGTFNCVFSDGDYLFCYHDKNEYNDLHFVQRKAPFGVVRLKDEDFEINLSHEKDPSQKGFIVATRPLTSEAWKRFQPGEFVVFKDGEIVFSR